MKKLVVILVFLIGLNAGYGQIMGNFGGGYNASFVKANTVNTIIGRYNQTRNYLSQPMDNLHFMDGISWNFHWIFNTVMFDFNFDKRKAEMSAVGNPGTGIMQRDLKFKSNTFGLGMGLNLMEQSPYLILGFDLDAGANSIFTRISSPEAVEDLDYDEITRQLMIGGTIWAQILLCNKNNSGIGLGIRPYYHFDFMKTNYAWFNEAINPNTHQADIFDPYGKMNNFGFQVILYFIIPELY